MEFKNWCNCVKKKITQEMELFLEVVSDQINSSERGSSE